MPLILRADEAADRPAFQRLIASVAGLEAYEDTAIERLTRHAFGANTFVTVVLAEEAGETVGTMAYYPGFNDAGLSINVVFLHVVEACRRSAAFRKLIDHARRIAGERGAASLNLAGTIFDERTCGMLQTAKRRLSETRPAS